MMSNRITATIFSLSLLVLASGGCDDRGTNSPPPAVLDAGGFGTNNLGEGQFAFSEFLIQMNNQTDTWRFELYIPRVSFPIQFGGSSKPVPLLVLLAPQDGDQFYYFNRGLKELVDELISDGTIEPMVIACMSNHQGGFGGLFYASSVPAGDYDQVLADKLIPRLNNIFPIIINDQSKRGIGGVGMGAYGAFRTALLHPGNFSSVSAVAGPLDFDGTNGSGGFVELFDDALTEQGLTDSTFKEFGSAGRWFLSRLFVGGALAFSAHDTVVVPTVRFDQNTGTRIVEVPFDTRLSLADSVTLITDLIGGAFNLNPFNMDFHLPFDGNGNVYQPIWDLWLNNNLENMETGSELSGVDMWFASSSETRFGFHEQTMSWISTLKARGYGPQIKDERIYSGYDGNPATKDQYLYDIMRDMLIFHSNSFNK